MMLLFQSHFGTSEFKIEGRTKIVQVKEEYCRFMQIYIMSDKKPNKHSLSSAPGAMQKLSELPTLIHTC